MPAILDVLKAEHKGMAKVLKVLEEELSTFEKGDAPDYELILMALDYLQDFPEKVHHPKEDLIYRQLASKREDIVTELADLEAEHREIAALVAGFRQVVDRILEEEEVSREVLLQRGQDLLNTHWAHMREEEERFFPISDRCLGPADWAEISLEASDVADPVFAARESSHFESLRKRILAA